MADRQKMDFWDWITGAAFLAMGVYLGLALSGLIELEGAAFWFTVVFVVIPFGFVFLLVFYMHDVVDRVLNGTIIPASVKRWRKRKPVPLLLSLPAGVVIGVVGAQFGLTEVLL